MDFPSCPRTRPLSLVPVLVYLCGAASAQAQTPSIALCPGLTIVTAVSQQQGDYESIKTVVGVDRRGVRVKYDSEGLVMDMLGGPTFKRTTTLRTLRPADLASATAYLQIFSGDIPEVVPNTTSIGTSTLVLEALRAGRPVEVGVFIPGFIGPQSVDPDVRPNIYDYQVRGEIRRVGAGPVTLPVLVDGRYVQLTAMHARGEFAGEVAEFHFLDDPANPLTLKLRLGVGAVSAADADLDRLSGGTLKAGDDKDVMEVVSIRSRCAGGAGGPEPGAGPGADSGAGAGAGDAWEKVLADSGRVEVYDIFFSFNSDRLRDESEPTLRRIASVLTAHPDWRLTIEGHTDSIASDTFNLELSKRRAAAVRAALVDRFKVAPGRLSVDGFGESRPKDTNSTLKGRARNRRVELARMR